MKYCALLAMVWMLALSSFCTGAVAERINQEGRLLGSLPVVTNAILFNTTNADAVVSAMQVFPVTNPWNECISNRPVMPNSDAMISQIIADITNLSRRKLFLFQEMNFVLIQDNQPLVAISFAPDYADESDLNGGTGTNGMYPIPKNLPIEGWPTELGGTVAQAQTNDDGGDRHAIMVQPGNGLLYETWRTVLSPPDNWHATNGAIFNLNTNKLRPDTWTSGDAAGFPMFPALVRYDECQRGMVEHACRLVVVKSRSAHIYPATHDAGRVGVGQTNYPAMGQRLRLKSSYVIPANWTKEEKALLMGLKKYGAMVSDNSSSFFSISITPDDRWGSAFNNISSAGLGITNFEVIQITGAAEGPRSAGAPVAFAGPDTTALPGVALPLQGAVGYSNTPPVTQWMKYSGPGTVTFGNASLTNTTATFNAPGSYTLELSASDGIHAVAYDAMIVTVTNVVSMSIGRSGTNVNLSWAGGTAPYVIQATSKLSPPVWVNIATTAVQSVSLPLTNSTEFFRIQSQ